MQLSEKTEPQGLKTENYFVFLQLNFIKTDNDMETAVKKPKQMAERPNGALTERQRCMNCSNAKKKICFSYTAENLTQM